MECWSNGERVRRTPGAQYSSNPALHDSVWCSSVFCEGHAHHFEQVQRFFVRSGGGHDRDVHSLLSFNLVQFNFRENRLVAHAQ